MPTLMVAVYGRHAVAVVLALSFGFPVQAGGEN